MKRLIFVVCVLFVAALSNIAIAGKPAQDIPITQTISDYDANNIPFYIQSDGLGAYINNLATKGKTAGTNSVLMSNVCNGLSNGDRLLESFDVRKVVVTLNSLNAIQPGDPNYLVPPVLVGTLTSTVRSMNTCTCDTNQSMYKMTAGSTIFCPMHFRLKDYNYRVDMGTTGENETERVQIYCNSADSAGCKEWTIDPLSSTDYTTNPGRTRARLVNLNTGANMGNFYMTFHLYITRP